MDTAIRPLAVDLYRLRCAVAALVVAVAHEGLLDVLGCRRADIAVRTLSAVAVRLSSTSAIRRAVERLICPDDDPDGSRTRGAIAELAELTHVDVGSASGLAAELLPSLPEPHQGDLFDDDESDLLDSDGGELFDDEEGELIGGEKPLDPGRDGGDSAGAGSKEDRPA